MNGKFKIPFGTQKGGWIMAIIFGSVTAGCAIFGFWKTLLILILAGIGYCLGSSPHLKDTLLRILVSKIENHNNDSHQ